MSYGEDNKDRNGRTVLHIAILLGASDLISTLIDYEEDLDLRYGQGMTPLHLTTRSRQLKDVELLLDNGARVQSRGYASWTPLTYALRYRT